MENNGWIKLHRKALDNDIIRDVTAWHIFTWLLLKVDRRTGSKKIAMRWASDELGYSVSTFHGALQRLVKKYKIANAKPNANYTEITLLNWSKYQSEDTTTERLTERTPNASRTLAEHLQEDKNKELRIIQEEQPAAKISNKLVISKSQEMAFLKEFSGLTSTEFKEQVQKCNAYMNMSSNNYTNPGLFFRGWLTRYVKEKTAKK